MKNLILYSDRYEAITKMDSINIQFHRLKDENIGDLDSFLHELVKVLNIENESFSNIFIPLSPIGSFTDYIGLRIALYLKLNNTKSKLSNIHIYGLVNPMELINNDCFQVISFLEVNLIDYSISSIKNCLDKDIFITFNDWKIQVRNLSLKVPEDYFDNHSIANEWGIYQMARNANIDIKTVDRFNIEKFNKLYFRWLIVKNELYEDIPDEQKDVQKRYAPKIKGIKTIGKIDLSKIPTKK